ncbi:peptidoglycan-recognition protein LF-like [Anthonomus grandis grandis]|uniref:peptidoglycan-recognition protein LF-like n=1 Tax=Anthonomus grandis grandis TaxID=2921223 RepID=UPI0021658E1A|nr:peptidoglycan-recognition protein LF-like [Anthonomus grandis grandis]
MDRDAWTKIPTKKFPWSSPSKKVFITDTGTPACTTISSCIKTIKNIQQNDLIKHFIDIKYNFLIGGSEATMFEGRGWNITIEGYPDTLLIALIGKYNNTVPNAKMMCAVSRLVEYGRYFLDDNYIEYSDINNFKLLSDNEIFDCESG